MGPTCNQFASDDDGEDRIVDNPSSPTVADVAYCMPSKKNILQSSDTLPTLPNILSRARYDVNDLILKAKRFE
jgi:hypothetical protein